MPSLIPTLRWITIVAWMVWLVLFWDNGWRSLVDIRNSTTKADSLTGTMLRVIITLLTLLIIASGLLVTTGFPMVLPGLNNRIIVILGITLTLFFMGATLYNRRYLGRFWLSLNPLEPGHQVVDMGPYGLVRHPIYTTTLVMYIGTVLVFATWWNMVIVLLVTLVYALKIREDDHFLAESLPGYRDYKERVPYRLIPRLY